jgi:hypothetical protein
MQLPDPNHSIANLIDQEYEKQPQNKRPHLGASLLGHYCDRWLWLSFRWAVIEKFPGRILRLFQRGQEEEEKIISWLRSIGIQINGQQTRVNFGAHVSGSLDGIVESGVPEAPKKRHVVEFKTHSLKSFNDLTSKGVKESKPQHWAQMQVYMKGTDIDRALYVAVCKDDDRIYTERVKYDETAAHNLIARGQMITLSERILEPISSDSSWYQCKYCPAHDFCFGSHLTQEINCRTCALSTPTKEGQWLCARYGNAAIPVEEQKKEHYCHVLHPDLTPWKLCDSDIENTALYEINGEYVYNGEPDERVIGSRELIEGTWKTEDDSFEPPF